MKNLLIYMMIIGTFLLVIGNVQSATIIVPTNQPTLAAAIAASVSGDTILINPGTYVNDAVLIKNKSLTVKGNGGRAILTLAGSNLSGQTSAFFVAMDSTYASNLMTVNLENLTILPAKENTSDQRAGWCLHFQTFGVFYGTSMNVTVTNCLLAPNNGSDQPVSQDGLLPVSLSGAIIPRVGGFNINGHINATLTNVISTHMNSNGTPGGSVNGAGFNLTQVTGGDYTINMNGCVASYCGRFGGSFSAYGNTLNLVGTPTTRNYIIHNGQTAVHSEWYFFAGSTSKYGTSTPVGKLNMSYTDMISDRQVGLGFYPYYGSYGGGNYSSGVPFTMTNCRFVTATTVTGGYGDPGNLPSILITAVIPYGDPTVSNCTFLIRNNQSGSSNCGIRAYPGGSVVSTNMVISDCIFAKDSASTQAIGIVNGYSAGTPNTNCIFNASYTDFATSGINALSAATVNWAGQVNMGTGVIYTGPAFQSENPNDLPISVSPAVSNGQPSTTLGLTATGGKYLNVTNAAFATAGSGGSALKGGAGFVSGGNYLTWTSSSSSIASLSSSVNNTATFNLGPSTGTAVLKATSVDGQAATAVVTVSPTSVDQWMLFDIKE